MLDIFWDFIFSTLEYKDWGLNTVTISFFVSLVLTGITGWGLIQQSMTLRVKKTAEALSIVWFTYYGVLQLVILTYGFFIGSAALMINGLLFLLYIPILIGLSKFKGFTSLDKLAALLFLLALLVMIVTPYKGVLFLVFAIGGLFSAITQPLEMWRKKSAQGLDLKLIGTILLGNVVWLIYGLAVNDFVLITINLIAFVIFSTTVFLARAYKRSV